MKTFGIDQRNIFHISWSELGFIPALLNFTTRLHSAVGSHTHGHKSRSRHTCLHLCIAVRYAKLGTHCIRPLRHIAIPSLRTDDDLRVVRIRMLGPAGGFPRISETPDLVLPANHHTSTISDTEALISGLMHGNAIHCAPSQSSTSSSTATQTTSHADCMDRGFNLAVISHPIASVAKRQSKRTTTPSACTVLAERSQGTTQTPMGDLIFVDIPRLSLYCQVVKRCMARTCIMHFSHQTCAE